MLRKKFLWSKNIFLLVNFFFKKQDPWGIMKYFWISSVIWNDLWPVINKTSFRDTHIQKKKTGFFKTFNLEPTDTELETTEDHTEIMLLKLGEFRYFPILPWIKFNNRPISEIPQRIKQVSHNSSFCDRSVHMIKTKLNSTDTLEEIWLMCRQHCACSWWRHQMETFSTLLALCEGNSPTTGEFP